MKPRIFAPLAGPHIEGRSLIANDQRCVNLYVKPEGPGGKTPAGLYRTPGLKYLVSSGPGPCRSNGVVFQDKAYFVSGNKLVAIDENFNGSEVGTLLTSQGRVSMARGWDHLLLVDSVAGYTYDGVTLTKIADPDFPECDHACWTGHHYITAKRGTNQFYVSALNDPTSWFALGFASAEAQPDVLIVPWAFQGLLILMGDETTELYRQTGNADFPFDPVMGMVVEYGIHAPWSVATVDNFLFFLGKSANGGPVAMMATGQIPTPISTPDLEDTWRKYRTIDNAVAFAYRQGGHTFYVITFPSGGETWCYDVTTGYWHQRSSYELGYHRAGGHVFFQDQHILGDFENERFYTYDFDTYRDGDDPLVWIRRAPVICDPQGNRTMFFDRLELIVETGLGLTTGQGKDPQVMLRWTNDGKTWGNELWRSMGKRGEYRTRVVWSRLGKGRHRVFEVSGSDPVPVALLGANLEARLGAA